MLGNPDDIELKRTHSDNPRSPVAILLKAVSMAHIAYQPVVSVPMAVASEDVDAPDDYEGGKFIVARGAVEHQRR